MGALQDPGRPADPESSPPADVLRAVQLMFARVAVGVVSAVVTVTSGDAIKGSIRAGDPALGPDEVESQYARTVGIAIGLGVVVAVLFVLLALQVLEGRNWARIVTWVVAGLGVLGGVLALFSSGTLLEKAITVIALLLDVRIIVLLASRSANEYFLAG